MDLSLLRAKMRHTRLALANAEHEERKAIEKATAWRQRVYDLEQQIEKESTNG